MDRHTGKISSLLVHEVFGTVRSMAPFRLTGGTKDYIIVGADSGRVVVLEYDPATNTLVKLQQETFGKSGSRRTVPGQYLAVDPKGRSIMLGAMDKAKLCVSCSPSCVAEGCSSCSGIAFTFSTEMQQQI